VTNEKLSRIISESGYFFSIVAIPKKGEKWEEKRSWFVSNELWVMSSE
jgi:hypothetical protein